MISREEKKVQNEVLLIPSKHPEIRLWRHTVGRGYGMYVVRNAMSLIKMRKYGEALKVLLTASPITFGTPGQSDVAGIHLSGRALWIECKAPGKLNEESDEQKRWGTMIRKFGGFYACIDNVEELKKQMRLEGVLN